MEKKTPVQETSRPALPLLSSNSFRNFRTRQAMSAKNLVLRRDEIAKLGRWPGPRFPGPGQTTVRRRRLVGKRMSSRVGLTEPGCRPDPWPQEKQLTNQRGSSPGHRKFDAHMQVR
jgi:hypothetical protein